MGIVGNFQFKESHYLDFNQFLTDSATKLYFILLLFLYWKEKEREKKKLSWCSLWGKEKGFLFLSWIKDLREMRNSIH